MTPARLTEIECPRCHSAQWIIDSDYLGAGVVGRSELTCARRTYRCATCKASGSGWVVGQQSPPGFLMQPHNSYPMTHDEFDHWVMILTTHFPDHPILRELGKSFFPRTPEEVAIRREAELRAHPVVEMRDQDGARRQHPDFPAASDWLDMMVLGDSLLFVRHDRAQLRITENHDTTFGARYIDGAGRTFVEFPAIDAQQARDVIRAYLDGRIPKE